MPDPPAACGVEASVGGFRGRAEASHLGLELLLRFWLERTLVFWKCLQAAVRQLTGERPLE